MADFNKLKADFMARVRATKTTRWIRFGIVSLIYFLWVAWMGNWWLALGWLLLLDIYITSYIPLTWWKKSKNPVTRTVMGWVDAIVYALVLVYFIFAFVGQNYQIPSSSLEKTLLTGDYLWVNKMIYGPRVPMTPVNFPLVHNKLPFLGTDSYLDSPSVSYKRLKGLRNVETGDIVVFNFPAGDTVLTKMEESAEYYYYALHNRGRDNIMAHPEIYGEVKYRPVDRRQNFVKRAVGLPGDTLRIIDDIIYINGAPQALPEHAQFNYFITSDRALDPDLLHELDVAQGDVGDYSGVPDMRAYVSMMLPDAITAPHLYLLPMEASTLETLRAKGYITSYTKANRLLPATGRDAFLFPQGVSDDWTLTNYGGDEGLWIPAKGATIKLNADTWAIYNRCIRNYEGHHEAYLGDDGRVYIGGEPRDTYTFAMDYYFMMGDNRDNSQDSRFWGFVPEDHIVGSPVMVLVSFDNERSIFDGGIRWDRILRDANPDK